MKLAIAKSPRAGAYPPRLRPVLRRASDSFARQKGNLAAAVAFASYSAMDKKACAGQMVSLQSIGVPPIVAHIGSTPQERAARNSKTTTGCSRSLTAGFLQQLARFAS